MDVVFSIWWCIWIWAMVMVLCVQELEISEGAVYDFRTYYFHDTCFALYIHKRYDWKLGPWQLLFERYVGRLNNVQPHDWYSIAYGVWSVTLKDDEGVQLNVMLFALFVSISPAFWRCQVPLLKFYLVRSAGREMIEGNVQLLFGFQTPFLESITRLTPLWYLGMLAANNQGGNRWWIYWLNFNFILVFCQQCTSQNILTPWLYWVVRMSALIN